MSCPLFDFPIPAWGSEGFSHGARFLDPDIGRRAGQNVRNPIPGRIFDLFEVLLRKSVWPASHAVGTNGLPIISTARKQNQLSSQKGRRPKFWSRIVITLSIFSFRAWFSAQIVVSSTIRAKNLALNENIDKVMTILDQKLGHRTFCVESGFCFGVVDMAGNA